MPEGFLRFLLYGDTVAINLALALVLGGWASDRWLAPVTSGWACDMARKARRVRRGGFCLGAAALSALGWLQASSLSEGADVALGTAAWTMITDTHLGHAWVAGFVGWSLAAAAAWPAASAPARPGHLVLAAAGLTAFIWSRSVVSHAGSHGDWSRYVAVDGLHLALVSLWVGIVLVAAAWRLPSASVSGADGIAASRWVANLSSTATVALAGIVLTGAFKSWAIVPSIAALRSTDYGSLLLVKVGLVTAAAALGGFNRFVVLPPLLRELGSAPSHAASHWRHQLVRAFRLEAVFLVLVLIVAAALSGAEPPTPSIASPLDR